MEWDLIPCVFLTQKKLHFLLTTANGGREK